MPLPRVLLSAPVAVAVALQAGAAWAAPGHAHQHGTAQMELALEGETLSIALTVPLDSLLGFERALRTSAERAAADAVLQKMGNLGAMLVPSPGAACTPAAPVVRAEVLTAKPAARAEPQHAEMQAELVFQCRQPAQLKQVRVALFEAFPRLHRIQAQWVTPGAQGQAQLRPRSPVLVLQK